MPAVRRILNRPLSEAAWGYLLIAPWAVGFLLFSAGPMIGSLLLSFTDFDLLSPPRWIGVDNYLAIVTGDPLFPQAVRVTLVYTLLTVPVALVLSLGLGIILNERVRGRPILRSIFFAPTIIPLVAAIFLWTWLLNPHYGLVNYLLGLVGIPGPSWLGQTATALPVLVAITLWATVGGTTMITFLAALQGVPKHLHDAASVDGAGPISRFRHVTLPMITPTIFFNALILIIGSFQMFTLAYVATGGGPNHSTYPLMLHIYNKGFRFLEMGYASALAWILMLFLLVFTYLQFRYQSRWVYYESGA